MPVFTLSIGGPSRLVSHSYRQETRPSVITTFSLSQSCSAYPFKRHVHAGAIFSFGAPPFCHRAFTYGLLGHGRPSEQAAKERYYGRANI